MELTLDNFPIPEDYREQLKAKQKQMELVCSLNKDNWEKIADEIIPSMPTDTRLNVETFLTQWVTMVPQRTHLIYYFAKLIAKICMNLPNNVKPQPSYFIGELDPEFFALLVRFGLYTVDEFKTEFAIHVEWCLGVLISILICLGPVLSPDEAEKFFHSIQDTDRQPPISPGGSNHNQNIQGPPRVRVMNPVRNPRRRLRSGSRSMHRSLRGSSHMSWGHFNRFELEEEEEMNEALLGFDYILFREYVDDHFAKAETILALNCKADGILTAIIADDIDWFTQNVDVTQRFLLGKHEYEFLNNIFNIDQSDRLLTIAAQFSAKKIFTFIAESTPSATAISECIPQIIMNQDMHTLRAICQSVTLTSTVFSTALKSPNLEIVKFIYDNCLGRSHLCVYPNVLIEGVPIPPSSIIFIVQHVVSPQSYYSEVFNSLDRSMPYVPDFLALFILYHGPYTSTGEELTYGFSTLYEANLGNIVREIMVKYKSFIRWQRLLSCIEVDHAGQFVRTVLDVFGPFEPKQLAKIGLNGLQMMTETSVREVINAGGAALLEEENDGLSFLCQVVWQAPIDIVTLAVRTEGVDINNSKHPEAAAPLHFAAARGEIAIVNALLNVKDIDVNRLDGYNRTPLDCAHNPAVVKALFAAGGRVSPFPRLDGFRDRDFNGIAISMHEVGARGPLHPSFNEINNHGWRNGWNYTAFNQLFRPVTSMILVGSYAHIQHMGGGQFELGSSTRNLRSGPYGFGGGTANQFMQPGQIVFGGYGTIGRRAPQTGAAEAEHGDAR